MFTQNTIYSNITLIVAVICALAIMNIAARPQELTEGSLRTKRQISRAELAEILNELTEPQRQQRSNVHYALYPQQQAAAANQRGAVFPPYVYVNDMARDTRDARKPLRFGK